jgi:hypothetical protein
VFARRNVPRRAGRHPVLNATHGEDGPLAAVQLRVRNGLRVRVGRVDQMLEAAGE